jgi:hypothetical protein
MQHKASWSSMLGLALGLAAGLAGPVQAQFVSAINRPSFSSYDTGLFSNDFAAQTSQRLSDFGAFGIPLAAAPGFRGLAGDDANARFFSISDVQVGSTTATNLFQVAYDGTATLVTQPFQVLPLGNALMQLNGIAYDTSRGDLYVFRNQAQNVAALGGWIQGGLFRVNATTGLMTATNLVGPPAGINPINVRGMAYDAVTDRIYLSQSRVGAPLEVFSWDPSTGATESILSFATLGFSDSRPPLIGAGGGKLVLLSQAEGHLGGWHREFDLVSRSFTGQAVATPYGPYGLFAGSPVIPAGGVAFAPSIPEPETWLLMALGLGGVVLRVRMGAAARHSQA